MTKSELYDALARTGKALSSGKRLEMLELLAQSERAVQELASVAGLNLTTASAHLQVLRDAGLVVSRRAGTRVIYRMAGDDVAELVTAMSRVAEHHRPEVRDAKARYLPDDVELMSRVELLEAAADGRVIVLDVRPRGEYEAGHLPGAVSIPVDELPDRLAEIPADAEVVAYCRGRYCVMSYDAVRLLSDAGLSARLLDEGVLEWRSDGVQTVAGGAQ
ncbi:metalloregulator ArsR/SmtB family transcription factor [Cellulomonas humilata]|uniref:Metalloregulator ArsR/SmtB family transcription factor n=1 Tax=Cellulomonas humilata TaxID=144055 RepID=A0A7Y5ZZU6_9CELL|nr:metalloregulator ArsR/SmtB family transcription factor [Cellulomonas humilata]